MSEPSASVTSIDTIRRPTVQEVCPGVFVVDGFPNESLFRGGNYLTHEDFERAATDLDISPGRGLGVFTTIVLVAALDHEFSQPEIEVRNDGRPANRLHNQLRPLLRRRAEVRAGSRDRVLIATQLAHDVFANIDNAKSVAGSMPITGRVGRRVLHQVLFDSDLPE